MSPPPNEKTIDFFDSQQLQSAQHLDLIDALRADLRSNEQTLSVADFADRHLPPPMRAAYGTFMRQAQFPQHAVTKNTEYIASKLRRRQRMVFSSGVLITTPPDRLKDLVSIDTSNANVTIVTIQGTVESQQ